GLPWPFLYCLFYSQCSLYDPALPSFPTRRSSDLRFSLLREGPSKSCLLKATVLRRWFINSMWLYQKNEFLLNADNVVYFSLESLGKKGYELVAHFTSGESLQIGRYKDKKEANKKFEELLANMQVYELEVRPANFLSSPSLPSPLEEVDA